MPQFILKLFILLSSFLSVNAVVAQPLSSIINHDTQQVEYTEHQQTPLSFIFKQTLSKRFTSLPIRFKSYLDSIVCLGSFDLIKESLLLVEALNTRQQYQIQESILLTILVQHHRKIQQTLYLEDNPISVPKKLYS